jgi:ABC-type antimicrobial peptide transport system permease subunit
VALVADLAIIYKFFMERTEWKDYIIYFSPYSIAMFAVCAVTLTVVFSLIFAYKSTQVQIVDYLKAE